MQIRASKEEDVVKFVFNEDKDWASSSFPDPLVTFDFSADVDLIAVTILGNRAKLIIEALDPEKITEF